MCGEPFSLTRTEAIDEWGKFTPDQKILWTTVARGDNTVKAPLPKLLQDKWEVLADVDDVGVNGGTKTVRFGRAREGACTFFTFALTIAKSHLSLLPFYYLNNTFK
jgi:hypothetical protein